MKIWWLTTIYTMAHVGINLIHKHSGFILGSQQIGGSEPEIYQSNLELKKRIAEAPRHASRLHMRKNGAGKVVSKLAESFLESQRPIIMCTLNQFWGTLGCNGLLFRAAWLFQLRVMQHRLVIDGHHDGQWAATMIHSWLLGSFLEALAHSSCHGSPIRGPPSQ